MESTKEQSVMIKSKVLYSIRHTQETQNTTMYCCFSGWGPTLPVPLYFWSASAVDSGFLSDGRRLGETGPGAQTPDRSADRVWGHPSISQSHTFPGPELGGTLRCESENKEQVKEIFYNAKSHEKLVPKRNTHSSKKGILFSSNIYLNNLIY